MRVVRVTVPLSAHVINNGAVECAEQQDQDCDQSHKHGDAEANSLFTLLDKNPWFAHTASSFGITGFSSNRPGRILPSRTPVTAPDRVRRQLRPKCTRLSTTTFLCSPLPGRQCWKIRGAL